MAPIDPWNMVVRQSGGSSIDEGEVRRALALMVDPGAWVQIQALPSGKWRHLKGDDLEAILSAVRDLAGEVGCYLSLNPFKGPLDRATRNADVLNRRWFLIDPDAIKSTGKNSSTTDAEKDAARQVTESVRDYLRESGWPDPVFVDSGNNWQLLYRIDLPNDKLSQQLLKRCLLNLVDNFNTPNVSIDPAVHDARRICKIPGTPVRKGANEADRPWRLARLISVPMTLCIVPIEKIMELAGIIPGGVIPDSAVREPLDSSIPQTPRIPIPGGESQPGPVAEPWKIPVRTTTKAAYVRAVVEDELDLVSSATEPGRNTKLFTAARNIASFVDSGRLSQSEMVHRLEEAGQQCGLGQDGDPHEIQRAIKNGFAWGLEHPRDVPDRTSEKQVTKPSPELPRRLPSGSPLVIQASKVVPKPVDWLWFRRIPRRFITIFYGTTGVGKSFVTLDIAARVTRGDCLPDSDNECVQQGNVLIISEDPFEYVLAPRLIELGADMERIFFMTWETMGQWVLDDIETLSEAFRQSGNPTLVVIDPPTNFLGDRDEHKNTVVRAALMKLVIWLDTQATSTACILITHVNKPSGKTVEAIYRLLGSVAWGSTARIAHAFTADPNDAAKCLFVCSKINLDEKPKALGYRIKKTESLANVEWLGEIDISADAALSGEKKKSVTQDVAEWIMERFRERREWPSEELKEIGFQAGHTPNSLFKNPIILAYPIKKSPHVTADGKRYWVWTAKPGWPPEKTDPGK